MAQGLETATQMMSVSERISPEEAKRKYAHMDFNELIRFAEEAANRGDCYCIECGCRLNPQTKAMFYLPGLMCHSDWVKKLSNPAGDCSPVAA